MILAFMKLLSREKYINTYLMSKRFTIVENTKKNKHMREMKVYTGGGDVILDLNVVNEKGMKSLPGSGKSLFKGPGVRGSMVSTRH